MRITCENQDACLQAIETIQPIVVAIVVLAVLIVFVWQAHTLRQADDPDGDLEGCKDV